MIRTPEDGMMWEAGGPVSSCFDTTELLHAYIAVLKLSEDHSQSVAKAMERYDPDDPVVTVAYSGTNGLIAQAARALHRTLFPWDGEGGLDKNIES